MPVIKTPKAVETAKGRTGKGAVMMWRLIKILLFLVVFGAVGIVAYAYVGPIFFVSDFAAPSETVIAPVPLEGD